MKNVLITGAEGFVGKNLRATLQSRKDLRLLCVDIQDHPEVLESYLEQADFIFHLAGVNRPHDADDYRSGNTGLTEHICSQLSVIGRNPALLISSSIQAELENPYGVSKKAAEDVVLSYGSQSGAAVYVYRLPNVFGKWSRPNYNSVVATFCHNIAWDLPINVNDPNRTMSLVYIDDVVRSFIDALDGRGPVKDGFDSIVPEYAAKLGDIAKLIQSFKASRRDLSVANMEDPLTKKLYSTYLSFLPVDQFNYALQMNVDDRGSFTEFIKTDDRGQVSVNISKPGITKGDHWHHTKNEKFLVVSGEASIRFRMVGGDEVTEYKVSGDKLEVVDIPTGYTHNISNVGSTNLVTVMWCNETFNPNEPDTYFEQV